MKFYGRQDELAELSKIRDLSREAARFTVVTGRTFLRGEISRGETSLTQHQERLTVRAPRQRWI